MLTRWGKQIDSVRVLDEYPRPQMVREDWFNLNGTWQYAIRSKAEAQPLAWDGEIRVPFCVESALSGVERAVTPTQRLWYQRKFQLQATQARTLLHFGAVDFECAVWVNQGYVGAHRGGFDTFTLDISPYVKAGDNEIVVGVTDPTSSEDQPRGKQHLAPNGIWYTAVTGIWQTVWLEQVPAGQHIEELRVVSSPGCDAVLVTPFLFRPSRDPELAVRVCVQLDGAVINTVVGRADREITVPIADPELWSPDTPVLYDIDVTLLRIPDPLPDNNDQQQPAQLLRQLPLRGATEAQAYAAAALDDGVVLDRVSSYCGLRSIELGPHPQDAHPTLLLNGKPVFQFGPLDQGWWPDGLHTPPADDAMVFEIQYLKSIGFNCLRKHIKVEPARYYYHCDRLGILVWQDMPSGFLPAQFVAPNDEGEVLRSSSAAHQFEADLQRMIRQLRHHPSIVVWVLHNEGWGQFATQRLTQVIRGLDPSRLINATSGWLDANAGDFIDVHDYAAQPSPPAADGHRALVLGEYGGVGRPLAGHLWNPQMRNWGYQTFTTAAQAQQAYAKLTRAIVDMYKNHGLCGAIYTQTTDVEGEVNGLLTYDRAVEKFPRAWLAELHSELV